MRPIKLILFGAIVTLSIFSAVLYSSCSKDECGAVTCLNGGTCKGGICKCKDVGIGGANCQVVYRNIYSGAYKGESPYDTVTGGNWLYFVPADDTMNYQTMDVLWGDTVGGHIAKLPAVLYNISVSGANFFVDTARDGDYRYIGNGSVNGNTASMRLVAIHDTGSVINLSFNSYIRH